MKRVFDEKSVTIRHMILEIPAGTVILNEGENNLDMYKLLSGHVEMYTGYGTENEVLLGLLGPGSCFGEFGLLTGKPAIYTIITYDNAKILRVTEEMMSEFMIDNQDSVMQIMRNMANNMLRMQHQITQLCEELAEANAEVHVNINDITKQNVRKYALNTPYKTNDDSKGTSGGMKYLNK